MHINACAAAHRFLNVCLLLMVLPAATLVRAAEAPPVREVYACSFINGSDMDDLMGARDYLVRQLDELDLELQAFLWTPFKHSDFDRDFLWFNNYENLNAWGAVADRYWGSEEGQSAQARFDQIIECSASLYTRVPIYSRGTISGGGRDLLVNASACKLRHGQSMAHVQDFLSHMSGVLDALPSYENFSAWMTTPIASHTDYDLRFFGVHNSVSDYTAARTELQSTDSGQMLARHFNQVMDCKTSLFWARNLIAPEE